MEEIKQRILGYLIENGSCGYTQIQFALGLKGPDMTLAIKSLYKEDKIMTSGSLDTMSLATKAYIKIWVNEE